MSNITYQSLLDSATKMLQDYFDKDYNNDEDDLNIEIDEIAAQNVPVYLRDRLSACLSADLGEIEPERDTDMNLFSISATVLQEQLVRDLQSKADDMHVAWEYRLAEREEEQRVLFEFNFAYCSDTQRYEKLAGEFLADVERNSLTGQVYVSLVHTYWKEFRPTVVDRVSNIDLAESYFLNALLDYVEEKAHGNR